MPSAPGTRTARISYHWRCNGKIFTPPQTSRYVVSVTYNLADLKRLGLSEDEHVSALVTGGLIVNRIRPEPFKITWTKESVH